MEQKLSGTGDMRDEIDALVKENTKSKMFLTKLSGILGRYERPNLRKLGREESQLKDAENVFNLIIEDFLT